MKAQYKIQVKYLGYKEYEDELFLTGGKVFTDYTEALDTKNKLKSMSSSSKYRLVKINTETL